MLAVVGEVLFRLIQECINRFVIVMIEKTIFRIILDIFKPINGKVCLVGCGRNIDIIAATLC